MAGDARREIRMRGLPLSEGYAVARVCMFNENRHSNLPLYRVGGSGVERELARVDRALEIGADGLEAIIRRVRESVGEAEAGIFMAQQMILRDATLRRKVGDLIRGEALNAEAAVGQVMDEYESRILALDNDYIKERASDFGEVKRRLLDVFRNMRPTVQCADEQHCQRGKNRIVVAEELTPTLTVDLEISRLLGLVTARGGVNSHGAILARALGIPAVSGIEGVRDRVNCGAEILVNGATGEVVVWPSDETLARVSAEHPDGQRKPVPVAPVDDLQVMANIRMAGDVQDALEMMAEGIGLYRTEIELFAAGRLLTEDELYANYRRVREAMPGRKIVYRAFDIGSDKKAGFLQLPDEVNPSLGWRGARLLLGRPDLFDAQARALARASRHGAVHVMYPMVVDREQFLSLRQRFCEVTRDIAAGEVHHGVMFEIPSACLQADSILEHADFGSIGTNDLTQYLFAIDRNNEQVASEYTYDRDILWQVIEGVADAARRRGKMLSLCGEMAGDPRYIPRLQKAGIRTVSVSIRRISAARSAAQGAGAAGRGDAGTDGR